MKLLSPAPRGLRFRGFTLIELLVVIAIIALLAAGSFGAYNKIMSGVRKKEATAMAMAISNGIEQFYADYNRLPKPISATEGTDSDATTDATDAMIQVLLGKEGDEGVNQNSRKIDYIEGIKPAKTVKRAKPPESGGSDKWANGLVYEDDSYEIVDSYGNYFKLRLDTDYNKELDNPDVDQMANGRTKLPKRVIIWSGGEDGKEETWDDNVRSWD